MNKIKKFALCAAYLLMLIPMTPIAIIWVVCSLIMYGFTKLEVITIREIDDEELTDAWNKLAETIYDCSDSANKEFLMEMEV